ncbi:amino acid ABC transporter permease [Aureimonas endophytica]|uniref:Amino acid ABC transporter permease n=1 Tax=Aureimonas endophytica TaxID=2027858 RepID=A0A917E147_9HYPH|nr:amino acid ABC transporter permease [Aureimonas endophytica]GGD90603.1 amino acid ABC transporter permease [Aureimonas endophytica]
MTVDIQPLRQGRSGTSWLTNPDVRGVVIQVLLVAALAAFGWWIVHNTVENLRAAKIASGFNFLNTRAGFDISQKPIEFTPDSSYGHAIVVGIVNTLIIAVSGIVMATILGFLVGIGRLSQNFLIRGLSTVYVEIFRNIPPLLVIIFWYNGVLSVLAAPRNLQPSPIGVYLTNRGLQTPAILFQPGAWATLAALVVGIVAVFVLARLNRRRQMATGERRPLLWPALGLVVGLPLLTFLATGLPATLELPAATRFNLVGGFQIKPEFLAMFLALSIYTGAFIAEIVRAGIMSVSRGQTEAAAALGLRRGQLLRLVIVPQAFRVIIPPLTSQYLNLTKNSSLGLAVGYAELVAIGSTVLNQSGQSVEVVAIWMCVYLGISLLTSIGMNAFNARMALKER